MTDMYSYSNWCYITHKPTRCNCDFYFYSSILTWHSALRSAIGTLKLAGNLAGRQKVHTVTKRLQSSLYHLLQILLLGSGYICLLGGENDLFDVVFIKLTTVL